MLAAASGVVSKPTLRSTYRVLAGRIWRTGLRAPGWGHKPAQSKDSTGSRKNPRFRGQSQRHGFTLREAIDCLLSIKHFS